MHKLALDPSLSFGWCLYLDKTILPARDTPYETSELLFYGTWNLGKNLRRGEYYLKLWTEIADLRRAKEIDEDDLEIVLESEAYGARRSEASAQMSAGWLTTLEIMCERRGLSYPRTVTTTSWRSAFIGVTQAPKDIKDTNKRRKWLKDAVMAECQRRKLQPKDDNSADALGIMFWMIQGGRARLDKIKADKKAKTAEKRAQAKLPLQAAA